MGKGQITGEIEDGQYNVKNLYYTGNKDKIIEALTDRIEKTQDKIDGATSEKEANLFKLQKASLQKRKDNLDAIPEDLEIEKIWCADLTEEMAGFVGIIEVFEQDETKYNIFPGSVEDFKETYLATVQQLLENKMASLETQYDALKEYIEA